jgi:serine/threonine protein kinase
MIITKLNQRYEVERELGSGTFGVAYLARDTHIHSHPVVIKILFETEGRTFDDVSDEPSFTTMFEREIKALAGINDPLVVHIYDYGWTPDGKPFIVMQYVEGQTLRAAMAGQAMEPERAARIVSQLGSALSAVHKTGVVHRDLKPENVMLHASSGNELAILIDFGIAKVEVSRTGRSEQATWAGTPFYMAPEQLQGHPVAASDVWALGVVAYELMTGRRPFSKADVFMLEDGPQAPSFFESRVSCPELSKAAQSVILKAFSYDPADRYIHAHKMGQAFRRAVREGGPRVPDPPPLGSELPMPTELLRHCHELFASFEEFRNPESLRAFFSLGALRTSQNCVALATRLEFDQLLDCLYRSGSDYRGQALVDVLSLLGSRYRGDYRGQECERLERSLKVLLEKTSRSSR